MVSVKTGTDFGELKEVLSELEELTSIDSIRCTGGEIVAHVYSDRSWKIEVETEAFTKKLASGKRFDAFLEALQTFSEEQVITADIDVLALISVDTAKTYDGHFVTHWARFSPAVPYEVVGDTIVFETMELELTADLFDAASESGLALYDEDADRIYIIRQCAFSSVGKLMDSAASFKDKAEYPIASAMMLAEKFCTAKKRKLISRGNGRIRSLIGITSPREVHYSQVDFINSCTNVIAAHGFMCRVKSWTVSDVMSVVTVGNDVIDFKLITSDAPGTSMSVTAYGNIGNGHIFLAKNKANHWAGFEKAGGAEALFSYLFKACKAFEEDVEILKKVETVVVLDDFNVFKKSLGSKRVDQVLETLKEGHVLELGVKLNAKEALTKIIDLTSGFTLGKRQQDVLEETYQELFLKEVLSTKIKGNHLQDVIAEKNAANKLEIDDPVDDIEVDEFINAVLHGKAG